MHYDTQNPYDLTGMTVPQAKEYIAHHLTSLKLLEKQRLEKAAEQEKWTARARFARERGAEDLAAAAEKETARLETLCTSLAAEAADLTAQIARMRTQLPGLGARERTVDPDLLEQELLMTLGYMPGEEDAAAADRALKAATVEAEADAALAALKAKIQPPAQEG